MKRRNLFLKSAAMALALALAAAPGKAEEYPETPEGAAQWLAAVEADFAEFSKDYAHVSWLNATYINHDSDTLAAKYGADYTLKAVGYANEAARYARIPGLDAVTIRKLDILRNGIGMPAPEWPGDQWQRHRGRDGQSCPHAR